MSRRLLGFLVALALPTGAWAQEPASPPVFDERIDVELASVVVRVLDRHGAALPGLGAADFRVSAGGAELPVVAVEWVAPGSGLAAGERAALARAGVAAPPAGRRLVIFVQASFEPSRMPGQLRLLAQARRLLATLERDDRVAVVSFDSHLKLRQDFTADRERLRRALSAAVRTGPAPRLRVESEPALAGAFDFAAARAAATPERALELTARALAPIPGAKTVVLLGWGLGRYGSTGVRMIPAYADARRALAAAHAAVFVLDVTDADHHSLEFGLQRVAEDTGGSYAKTHLFPIGAVERLARAIAGHYVLYYRPAAAAGRLRVELRDRRRGQLLVGRAAAAAEGG